MEQQTMPESKPPKRPYESPQVDYIMFSAPDVIMASGGRPIDIDPDQGEWDPIN